MTGSQGGRPSRINDVIRTTQDGRDITVRDVILDALAAGNYVESASALAGIPKASLYDWLKIGNRASADVHNGRRPLVDLSDHEQECLAFSDAVAEAQARSEARDVAQLAELARGGRSIESSSIKRNARGAIIESTNKTETAEPNAAVLMWRLERRFPDRWGRRRLELSGPDGGPIEVDATPAERLLDTLSSIAERTAAAAVVTADEGGESPPELPPPDE